MASSKPALVLLHGMTSSGQAWQPLVGELSCHFDVHAPTALGHRGGNPAPQRTTLTDIVDDAERYLDQCGLQQAHLVGHSMGGYTAIELARRGRAISVTVFSPGGFWAPGDGTARLVVYGVRRSVRIARLGAPLAKAVVSTVAGRRLLMGSALRRPDAMTSRAAREVINDQAGCEAGRALAFRDDEIVRMMDPLPCPVTVVWAEHDKVLPMADYADAVRARLPDASFVVLQGVGHAAMVDDPELVIDTILGAARR